MKNLLLGSALAALVFMPSHSFAAAEKYNFDKLHTQIVFFADHLGFSHSSGKFLGFDGHFTFDREHPENSDVEITIDTNSVNMDDEKWDEHLKSADFLNVEKFPTMTFKSTGITVTGDNTADITGDLTLLGVTKPVVLKVIHNKSGTSPYGGEYKAGFSATTTIKRSDFGMEYGLPAVGDNVDIRIEVEAVRDDVASGILPH